MVVATIAGTKETTAVITRHPPGVITKAHGEITKALGAIKAHGETKALGDNKAAGEIKDGAIR